MRAMRLSVNEESPNRRSALNAQRFTPYSMIVGELNSTVSLMLPCRTCG